MTTVFDDLRNLKRKKTVYRDMGAEAFVRRFSYSGVGSFETKVQLQPFTMIFYIIIPILQKWNTSAIANIYQDNALITSTDLSNYSEGQTFNPIGFYGRYCQAGAEIKLRVDIQSRGSTGDSYIEVLFIKNTHAIYIPNPSI